MCTEKPFTNCKIDFKFMKFNKFVIEKYFTIILKIISGLKILEICYSKSYNLYN